MKKHLFAIAAITIAFISCGPVYVVQSTPQTPPPDETPEITYQTFYDDLSPYGQWIDYPEYGYVWMPNAGPDFRPYATNGQWVNTNDGWAWSSGYNWGWATFHYGRWFFDANYGWMWIPGYQWAPAWVSWRQSQDYYGWAPLGPRVNAEIAVSNYNPPANYWCFVPHQYVASPSVSNYYVNETRNTTIINNTTVINNYTTVNNVTNNNTNITNNNTTINNNRTTVNNNVRNNFVTGPDPREVSRFTGSTITPAVIRQSASHTDRLNNGQLEIYRPRVNANATSTNNNAANNNSQPQQRVAPTHFVPLSNARPMFNRPANNTNNEPNRFNNNNQNQQPVNNTNNTPANTNNNPNRPNNNQNQQPVNNTNNNPANTSNNPNRPNNNQNQQPVNNTNNNPANTNNNPNRPNNDRNQQPVNNTNNNPNRPSNNRNQQPVNNTDPNNNSNNRNQNNRPANNQAQQNQNNNANNSNRRFNRQQQDTSRTNKNFRRRGGQ